MPTLEEMLGYVTERTQFLTDEANRELLNAGFALRARAQREQAAFMVSATRHTSEAEARALYALASPWEIEMPPRPGYTDHERRWGMLYGMVIGQLNDCLETSGCPAARRAAIDYLRREAAKRGVHFA